MVTQHFRQRHHIKNIFTSANGYAAKNKELERMKTFTYKRKLQKHVSHIHPASVSQGVTYTSNYYDLCINKGNVSAPEATHPIIKKSPDLFESHK